MAKDFKKGDAVTIIQDWDRRGTVSAHNATVYSCGKVRMVLTDTTTGEELGREFSPNAATGTDFGTRMRLTADELATVGLAIATRRVEATRAIYLSKLEEYKDNRGFCFNTQEDLDELHTPKVELHDAAWHSHQDATRDERNGAWQAARDARNARRDAFFGG